MERKKLKINIDSEDFVPAGTKVEFNSLSKARKIRYLQQKSMERIKRAVVNYSNDLPHEFLLKVMNGQKILHAGEWIQPDFETRLEAARAAAPYFAPKLATVEVNKGMNDNELDEAIKRLAAETGITITATRESSERSEKEEATFRRIEERKDQHRRNHTAPRGPRSLILDGESE